MGSPPFEEQHTLEALLALYPGITSVVLLQPMVGAGVVVADVVGAGVVGAGMVGAGVVGAGVVGAGVVGAGVVVVGAGVVGAGVVGAGVGAAVKIHFWLSLSCAVRVTTFRSPLGYPSRNRFEDFCWTVYAPSPADMRIHLWLSLSCAGRVTTL